MVLHLIDLGDNQIFSTRFFLLGDIVEGTEVREVIKKSIGKSVSTKKRFSPCRVETVFSSCKIDFSLLKIVTNIRCDHEVVLGFGRVIPDERFLLFLVTNCQKVVKDK